MSTKENKALVRQYFEEVWNQRNLQALGAYVTDDVRDYAGNPDPTPGHGSVIAHHQAVFSRLSDFHIELEDLIAEGDTVVAFWTSHGTDVATGKRLSGVRAISRLRVVGGKVAEYRVLADYASIQRQLADVPAARAPGR